MNQQVRDYDGLVDALRERASAIGLSYREIENQTGLATGYVSKLLSPAHPKTLGPKSLNLLLNALGLHIAVIGEAIPKRQNGSVPKHRTRLRECVEENRTAKL